MTGISNYGMGPLRAKGNAGTGKTQGTGSASDAGSTGSTPVGSYDASTDTFNGGSIEIYVDRQDGSTRTTVNYDSDHHGAGWNDYDGHGRAHSTDGSRTKW